MFYLDASVLIAAVTNEDHSASAQDWLQSRPPGDVAFSSWTLAEVASGLAVKCRRGEITAAEKIMADGAVSAMIDDFEHMMIAESHFLAARRFVDTDQAKLRASDALHAAIAADYEHTLATLDRGLAFGCTVLGLEVLLLSASFAQ